MLYLFYQSFSELSIDGGALLLFEELLLQEAPQGTPNSDAEGERKNNGKQGVPEFFLEQKSGHSVPPFQKADEMGKILG